jgi:C-terminal processing protease CtpA/Prc
MSKESQSVAADLFRLEAQLASVSKQPELASPVQSKKSLSSHVVDNLLASTSDMSVRSNSNTIGAEPIPRPSPVKVLAPPGKLGILLANKAGQNGPTHVSAVRSESVLAGKVHVGDRFASIDGEDVSRMNSKEITTIMARKSDFEREIVFVPLQSTKSNAEWI